MDESHLSMEEGHVAMGSQSIDDLVIFLVLKEGDSPTSCSPGLLYAFNECETYKIGVKWMSTEDCLQKHPVKTDAFILDEFEGPAYEHVSKSKAVIMGPRCFLTCLERKEPVPRSLGPIYNVAMRNLVVTLSGFSQPEKDDLVKKIECMAGIYSNSFSIATTHLIVKKASGKKYEAAVEKDIPIMTADWVHQVWVESTQDFRIHVSATDRQFLPYCCPAFFGISISSTGLSLNMRQVLKKEVEKNGGIYSGMLVETTDVLIAAGSEGEKFHYAKKWGIPRVSPEWIADSLERCVSLPFSLYEVRARHHVSTPTNENDEAPALDESLCSRILNDTTMRLNCIDETEMDSSYSGPTTKLAIDVKCQRSVSIIDQLDLQQVMKAGHFLDGCKVYYSGFEGQAEEKLRRVLKAAGATKFNQLKEPVTHVILGKPSEEIFANVRDRNLRAQIVTADWILDSMQCRRPAPEEDFLLYQDEGVAAEPMLPTPKPPRHIKTTTTLPNINVSEATFIDESLMEQYGNAPVLGGPSEGGIRGRPHSRPSIGLDDSDDSVYPSSQVSPRVFDGLVFFLIDLSTDDAEKLEVVINENGGDVFTNKSAVRRVDFCILPDSDDTNLPHSLAGHVKEFVSLAYIVDCVEKNCLLPIEYFYLPIVMTMPRSQSAPLTGCVVTLSSYLGRERSFLATLVTLMGAVNQEMLVRRDKGNEKACTHVVAPHIDSDKARAALKWKLCMVTSDWLVQCTVAGERLSEEDFHTSAASKSRCRRKMTDSKAYFRGLIESRVKVPSNNFLTPLRQSSLNCRTPMSGVESSDSPVVITEEMLNAYRIEHPTPIPSAWKPKRQRPNVSLSEMSTPDTPYGSTWHPNPSPRTRKYWKRVIDSMPTPPPKTPPSSPLDTPIGYYYDRCIDIFCPEVGDRSPYPLITGIDGSPNPLAGVVLYVAYRVQDIQKVARKTIVAMGGIFKWLYDDQVTHFIFRGGKVTTDQNKELKRALMDKKIIVHPDWLWACRDQRVWVDESLYPLGYDPSKCLPPGTLVTTKRAPAVGNTPTSKKGKGKSHRCLDTVATCLKFVAETADASLPIVEDMFPLGPPIVDTETEQREAALARHLQDLELMAEARRRSSVEEPPRKQLSFVCRDTTEADDIELNLGASRLPDNVPMNADTESQSTAITWDDPVERAAREQLRSARTRDTQQILDEINNEKTNLGVVTMEEGDDVSGMSDGGAALCVADVSFDVTECDQSTTICEDKYVFSFTGLTDKEKVRYESMVATLGASVYSDRFYDDSVSHLICTKSIRSEKLLGAIASGKWVLYPAYVEECTKAGKFLQEEPFEFGNPDADRSYNSDDNRQMAAACQRWRRHLQQHNGKEGGVFAGMRVLVPNLQKASAYARLIKAGGGEAVHLGDDSITFVIVEPNNGNKADLAHWASLGIPCVLPMFLNDMIINDPMPDAQENCIDEYKQILRAMSCSEMSLIRRSGKKSSTNGTFC